MVISTKIKCETCDTSIYIKYQMDEMIKLYPWNLDFCCPNCGDRIHVTFSPKGLNCKHTNEDDNDRAYMIGYSSCLPITKELYLSKTERVDRMAFFSPYFNLIRIYHDGDITIGKHSLFIKKIVENVLLYKNSLSELLPLLNKQNMKPEAYTKKMAKVFDIKDYRHELSTYTECIAQYAKMVECCYINIKPITIASAPYGSLFIGLIGLSNGMDTINLKALKDNINQYYNLKDWLVKNAFSYIASMIGKIEKYFPAMFYGVTGEYTCPHENQLYIVTINNKEVNEDYSKGYEVLEKILPAVVAIESKLNGRDVNDFGVNVTYTMNDFVKLPAGMKVGILQKNDVLKNYFINSLNNKIRNSEAHDDFDFDADNQICRFIDIKNPCDITEIPLMDVAFMTYIQLIHIMEISLVVNTILQRTWN